MMLLDTTTQVQAPIKMVLSLHDLNEDLHM